MLNYFCVLNFFQIEVKSSILRGVCVCLLSVCKCICVTYVCARCACLCTYMQWSEEGVRCPTPLLPVYSLERLSSTEPGLGSLRETHLKPLVSNSHSAMDTNTRIVVLCLSWVLEIWTQALSLKSKCSWPLSHVPRQRDAFNINLQIIKMACSWNNQKKNRHLKLDVKECVLPLQSTSVPWRLWPAVSIHHFWLSCHQRKGPWEGIPSDGKRSGKPMIIWVCIRQLKPRLSTRRKLKGKGALPFTSRATGVAGQLSRCPFQRHSINVQIR